MFYFAKALQAAAMAVVALALYVGLSTENVRQELVMLVIGVTLFLSGRLIEQRLAR